MMPSYGIVMPSAFVYLVLFIQFQSLSLKVNDYELSKREVEATANRRECIENDVNKTNDKGFYYDCYCYCDFYLNLVRLSWKKKALEHWWTGAA